MRLRETEAAESGGGFAARGSVRLQSSSMEIEHSRARGGGGFEAPALELIHSSLSIREAWAQDSGGAFELVAMPGPGNHATARITDSTVVIEHCTAMSSGGAFRTTPPPTSEVSYGEVLIAGSSIKISHVTAGNRGGSFLVGSLRMSASEISLEHAAAGRRAAGFMSWNNILIANQSRVALYNMTALEEAGISAGENFELKGGSTVHVEQSEATEEAGGISVHERTRIARGSVLELVRCSAAAGGGLRAGGEVVVVGGSRLQFTECRARTGSGGGLMAAIPRASVRVTGNSTVTFKGCRARRTGGGGWVAGNFSARSLSWILVSGAASGGAGGGLNVQGSLRLEEQSTLVIANASASTGGGLYIAGSVKVHGKSSLSISKSIAQRSGGALAVERALNISGQSKVSITDTVAQEIGGGFTTSSVSITQCSMLMVLNCTAQDGGAFWVGQGGVEVSNSSMQVSGYASRDGGGFFSKGAVHLVRSLLHVTGGCAGVGCGFFAGSLSAETTKLSVSGPEEADTRVAEGSGGFLRGPLRLERSELVLQRLQQGANALRAQCLAISEESLLSLEAATEVGVSLQNAGCACPATLQAIGNITGMGMSDALLSAEACANETIEITGVHLQTRTAAVAKTSSHTVIHNVTVDFLGALNGEAPILLAPSFDAKELRATCSQCPHGLTFGVFEHGLSTLSTPRLHCGHAATLVQGFTERCDCKAHQVHDKQFSDQVQVSQTRSYCVDCPRHHEDHEDECQKCPMHKARRDQDTQRI